MCLAVPMELTRIDAPYRGIAAIDGVERSVDLSLVPDPVIGEYVIVHAGFAIERLDRKEAEARLELFQDVLARYNAAQPKGAGPCDT